MKIKLTLLAISYAFLSQNAFALDEVISTECPTTPAYWELSSMPETQSSNNLRRRAGSLNYAQGEFIEIYGRLMDSECTPIVGAVIEVSQANANGVYNSTSKHHDLIDPNFVGTGKAITDNLGYYSFLTIIPGAIKSQAPHIRFHVRHQDFLDFETYMYFEDQAMNQKDKTLNKKIESDKRDLLVAKYEKNINNDSKDIKYRFDITLEGTNKYLKY
jgi:protocatechuate 3,4-dioxygenase beta subunit